MHSFLRQCFFARSTLAVTESDGESRRKNVNALSNAYCQLSTVAGELPRGNKSCLAPAHHNHPERWGRLADLQNAIHSNDTNGNGASRCTTRQRMRPGSTKSRSGSTSPPRRPSDAALALQAKQVHVTYLQQMRVRRSVRRVARLAALRFHRDMLEDEGT